MKKDAKNEPIRLLPQLITLSEKEGEESVPKKVELLKAGRYEYEGFFSRSLLTIDTELFTSLKKNFEAGIRKTKLAVDYGHDNGGPAAGWIEGVELSEDGKSFCILVDWTPTGRAALANKEYCYISAEFHQNYRDNETGKLHGPTLFGAGLTNRPFIKGMKPVELSDDAHKGDDMTLEQQIEKLQADMKALTEANAKLAAENTALTEKVAAAEKEQALAKKEATFQKMLSEGKAVPAQKEAFMADDVMKFAELAAPVKLEEKGHGRGDTGVKLGDGKSKTPAQDEVLKLAAEKSKADGIALPEAISFVLGANPELDAAYQKETTTI